MCLQVLAIEALSLRRSIYGECLAREGGEPDDGGFQTSDVLWRKKGIHVI